VAVGLSVTILGCSGGYAGAGGACSGYLVRSGDASLWLDAGSGTFANLQRHISMDQINAIVLSHEHPDHWRDIEGLYVAYKYGDSTRQGIPIYAPAPVRTHAYFATEPVFAWNDVADGGSVDAAGFRLSFSRTDHPVETLAVRIERDGRALAFSADTGPRWSFADFGQPINLALCEATLTVEDEGTAQHVSGRQAGASAEAAGVEHLVLTHFWPANDPAEMAAAAKSTFTGRVSTAAIGEEYYV